MRGYSCCSFFIILIIKHFNYPLLGNKFEFHPYNVQIIEMLCQIFVSRGGRRWPVDGLRQQHVHTSPLLVCDTVEAFAAILVQWQEEDEDNNVMDLYKEPWTRPRRVGQVLYIHWMSIKDEVFMTDEYHSKTDYFLQHLGWAQDGELRRYYCGKNDKDNTIDN